MKGFTIPGWGELVLKNVVLDLNGTVTEAGDFIPGVLEGLQALRNEGLHIYILSGDTRGTLSKAFDNAPGIECVLTKTGEDKRVFVESISPDHTVCVGNGNIDVDMFKASKLSICTIQAEGASTRALQEADIVVTHIKYALEMLLDPQKLIATLRG
jgi:soluble P-type ATPase